MANSSRLEKTSHMKIHKLYEQKRKFAAKNPKKEIKENNKRL